MILLFLALADGKKGGHAATPHPSKQAGKTTGKSPKSGGQFSCGSCNKYLPTTFRTASDFVLTRFGSITNSFHSP